MTSIVTIKYLVALVFGNFKTLSSCVVLCKVGHNNTHVVYVCVYIHPGTKLFICPHWKTSKTTAFSGRFEEKDHGRFLESRQM